MELIRKLSDQMTIGFQVDRKLQLLLGLAVLYSSKFLQDLILFSIRDSLRVVLKVLKTLLGGNMSKVSKTTKYLSKNDNHHDQQRIASVMDDRKATIADEGELYMLETHGYDKHRFLSKSFIKRNKLLKRK
jgi:hypothetical protein